METFEVSLEIAAPVDKVMAAFWDVTRWPEVAPHVTETSLIYDDQDVQVIMMKVVTLGRVDRFKTVRVRQGLRIHFIQPTPPAIFHFHTGIWHFKELPLDLKATAAPVSVVSVTHNMQTNTDAAKDFLRTKVAGWNGPDTQEGILTAMQQVISNNSLQTIRGLKTLVEREYTHAEYAVQ